jgi:hypothetical protein
LLEWSQKLHPPQYQTSWLLLVLLLLAWVQGLLRGLLLLAWGRQLAWEQRQPLLLPSSLQQPGRKHNRQHRQQTHVSRAKTVGNVSVC